MKHEINPEKVDLHLHSSYSDGSDTPTELIQKAKTLGLEAIALTDHDTIESWEELLSSNNSPKTIPGVELSIQGLEDINEVHLLAYFNSVSAKVVKELREYSLSSINAREKRLSQMVTLLKNCGLQISEEEVRKEVKSGISRGIINRYPHVTNAVYRLNPNRFSCPRDILVEYLLPGREAYVPVGDRLNLKQAIDWVRSLGGISVLAHPRGYNDLKLDPTRGERILLKALEYGADGGEGHYVYHKNEPYRKINAKSSVTSSLCQHYIQILTERGKIATSGSDYHGKNKPIEMGEQGGRVYNAERLLGVR